MKQPHHLLYFIVVVLLNGIGLMLVGCGGGSTPVPTPSSPDGTPPTAQLSATRLAKGGNTLAETTLTQSSGPVNWSVGPDDTVVITAKGFDPEGVQNVQVWVSPRVCHTTGATQSCTSPLLGNPVRELPQPAGGQHFGELTTPIYAINITNDRAGGADFLKYEINATAINYPGQKVNSPTLTVTWP